MALIWTADLDTGIDLIDQQHKQIVEFINRLESAQQNQDALAIQEVVDGCVAYTRSHFAFEESLLESVGYAYCKAHKRVHELFTRRIAEYQTKLERGQDVGQELHDLLSRWLISHIKGDDANYVATVKASMISLIKDKEEKNEAGWLQRFFK